jgi:hypothetical protein
MIEGDRPTLLGRRIPPSVPVRRVALAPGDVRASQPAEWADDLVVVERGEVEVRCADGSRRSYGPGSMLCLSWVDVASLANASAEPATILAIHRPPRSVSRRRPSTSLQGDRPMSFRTTLLQSGPTATGFEVPPEVVEALGAGRRPPVRVTLNGTYTYRNTVAVMGGVFMIGVSAEHRAASGVKGGDEITVELALDTEPREIAVPDDLRTALDADSDALRTWDGLSYSLRRYHVDQVNGAKTDETRQRRIAKSVATLHEGRAR